jgi:hypothetical protein
MGSSEISFKPIKGKTKQSLEKKYGKDIRIGRKNYKILYVNELTYEGRSAAGLCDSANQTIYIDPSVDDDIQTTLLHEICHAELSECGIRQCPGWTWDMEEMIAENISQGISLAYRLKRK